LDLIDGLFPELPPKPPGRGRKETYDAKTIFKIFTVMMIKRIHHFKTLHRYLTQNPTVVQHCGLDSVPARRTLGRRLKSLSPCVEEFYHNYGESVH
jgi:hypothetical protein